MRDRLSNVLKGLALMLVSAGFFVLLLEGAIRLFLPQPIPTKGFYVNDPDTVYRLAANLDLPMVDFESSYRVKTNELGFRDEPVAGRRAERTILFLGDSYTFGYGIKQEWTLVEQAERMLNAGSRAPHTRCVNTGVPGFGTFHELALLRKTFDAVRPDAVILAFYTGNDFQDNADLRRRFVRDGFLIERTSANRRGLIPFLSIHSHLYRLLVVRVKMALQRFRLGGGGERGVMGGEGEFAVSPVFRLDYGREAPLMSRTFGNLEELIAFCREKGTPFGLVVLPTPYQMTDRIFAGSLAYSRFDPKEYGRTHPNDLLRDFARENGVPYLDLLPVLEPVRTPVHFMYHKHFNRHGNRLAAQAIVTRLLPQVLGERR